MSASLRIFVLYLEFLNLSNIITTYKVLQYHTLNINRNRNNTLRLNGLNSCANKFVLPSKRSPINDTIASRIISTLAQFVIMRMPVVLLLLKNNCLNGH